MFYNKRIFKRCFSYNKKYWYKNITRIPLYFRLMHYLVKYGYDEYATWETHHWFTITMKSILTKYRNCHYAVAILPNVKKKIAEYVAAGDEVIFTRDTHDGRYLDTNEGKHLPIPHCFKGAPGWNVVPEIDIPDCEHIDKPTFGYPDWEITGHDGGFTDRNFEEIEIIGVCTDICVVSNALILKAFYPEMRCRRALTAEWLILAIFLRFWINISELVKSTMKVPKIVSMNCIKRICLNYN